ncbi:MAG: carboxylesterase [Sideroxydans sp.]|nr:carboxylesterase [Sideroxydans sp.]
MSLALIPHIILETGNNPQYSLIWLHGLGANGEDFVPIADEIRLPQAVRYLFPHAPKRAVTINGGLIMPAWYDIRELDIGAQQDVAGIQESQQKINQLIEREIAQGIPPAHIFLVGFSQGGAMALHCGLRFPQKLGGILALSSYLPLADRLPEEVNPLAKLTPVLMAHGHHDAVVPYSLGQASANLLQQQGCNLEWHDYAMSHTVCSEEVCDIEKWLQQRVPN